MIDRKSIYEEVKNVMYGNWGNLIIGSLIVFIIGFAIDSILDNLLPTQYAVDFGRMMNYDSMLDDFRRMNMHTTSSNEIIKVYLSSVVSYFLSGALSLAILDFVRASRRNADEKFHIDSIFKAIQKYPTQLLLVSLIISLVGLLLSYIPFIGFILRIVLSIMIIFVVYMIPEYPHINIMDLFKKSIDKTNGIKGEILAIILKYWLIPLIILLAIIFMTGLSVAQQSFSWVGLLFIALIALIVSVIRAAILNNVSVAILYDNISHNGFEDQNF